MRFSNCSAKRRTPLFALLAVSSLSFAQSNVLTVAPPPKMTAKAGSTAETTLSVRLRPGYHCNSNTPSDDYLIPLKITWTASPLEVAGVSYPKPQMEHYSFSDKPLSVYTGDFQVTTRFKVPANAAPGLTGISAKIRYQ